MPRRASVARSDDLFLYRVPAHGASGVEALDRHAAGDGNAEADLERAVVLPAGAGIIIANDVEKVLHMGAGRGIGLAQHFDAVRPIHFLRQVADLLAFRDGAVGA